MSSQWLRTIDEVLQHLANRFPQAELSYVKGQGGNEYGYVPWEKSVRILNDIFGPFGWKEEVIHQSGDTNRGVYSCTVRVTVYAVTSTEIIETSRDGVGVGIVQGDHAQAHDTAIKGAASDGLSRAVKLLGDAFGMFLYDKGDPARQQTSAPRSVNVQGNVNNAQIVTGDGQVRTGGPSASQITYLNKNGIGAAQAAALTSQQATQILGFIWPKDGSAPLSGPDAYNRVVNGVVATPQPVGATNGNRKGDDFAF